MCTDDWGSYTREISDAIHYSMKYVVWKDYQVVTTDLKTIYKVIFLAERARGGQNLLWCSTHHNIDNSHDVHIMDM